MIEKYIEQNFFSRRMEIEHHIELIHYHDHIRALKLEYFLYNSNTYQVCFFFKEIFHIYTHYYFSTIQLETINERTLYK
jgi:hypothetical protein